MMYFGKNIKKIRSIKKLSQSAFAEIFGITRSSIGAYEEGRAEPKLEIIIKIANYFSISVDSLVNNDVTVNELSHFQIPDNFLDKDVQKGAVITDVKKIPFITTSDINQKNIEDALNNTEHSISLPNLNEKDGAILIEDVLFKELPKQMGKNDIIVVNPNCNLEHIKLKGKYCLVKKADGLFVIQVSRISNNKYLLHLNNDLPLTVSKKDLQYILPIEKHISNAPVVVDDATEKIKKLEFMVQELYNRLE